MEKKKSTHFILAKLSKIMNDRKLKQNNFALLVGFPESKMSKILAGTQNLSIDDLSKIASSLNMREIDIYTYPKVFREVEVINSDIKAQLTIELKDDLKERVLDMVFGNDNLELIKK